MKTTLVPICSLAVCLVVVSCSPTQVGVGSQRPSTLAASAGGSGISTSLSVVNDPVSNQAVYISEAGSRTIVQTAAGADGPGVRCVYSSGFASIQQTGGSDSLPVKGVVVGQRDDGNPGIWEIDTDNSIQLVQNEQAGTKGLLAPQQAQFPNSIDPRFGWVFHATAISADGRIIVGYAANPKGFTSSLFSIPAGTTIGIYWQVQRASFGNHVRVSAPFVIGSWQAPSKPKGFHPRWATPFPSFLTQLKIFLLNELQSYLIMATAVSFDQVNNDYVVTGTDQDGEAATATIAKNGQIVITPIQSTTTSYSEIVIDTYDPTGSAFISQFQYMELFSASGVTGSADPWASPSTGALASDLYGSNPAASQANYAYIDYKPTQPLVSGTVLYIRISGITTTATGAYAITVLTSPPTTFTTFASANATDAPYAAGNNLPVSGGVPTDPAVITLGGALNRYVLAGAVEWVQITLP
jgi:hypothetical protein